MMCKQTKNTLVVFEKTNLNGQRKEWSKKVIQSPGRSLGLQQTRKQRLLIFDAYKLKAPFTRQKIISTARMKKGTHTH